MNLSEQSLQYVWHPCSQMARLSSVPPLGIKSGKGGWVFDEHGNRYFDAISSWWVNLLGHSNERINAAIKYQLDNLPHVMLAGCTHEPVVKLAARLSERTARNLGHVFFASDGSSAVEIALKQSFHYWRQCGEVDRTEFVCLSGSYHGETLGALSVTDVPLFRDAYGPLLLAGLTVQAPDSRLGNEEQALAEMSELLSTRSGQISAVIVEPRIQGGAGMVMHSVNYLKKVRALTRQHNVHLIADEIAVGCGRTGSFFAWDQVDRENWPDMLLLSKGITGGNLPLSLVMTTDKIFEAFWDNDFKKGFLHSHSYTGNPLACAAANAVLDHFDEGLEKQIRIQADSIRESFAHFDSEPRIGNLRQCGMVLAFDVAGVIENFAEKFHLAAREHELLIRPIGQTVYVMPPFVIDKDLSQHIGSAVTKTLHEVLSNAL